MTIIDGFKGGIIHDSKYRSTRVLFASTYTAKQLKTLYYSLSCTVRELAGLAGIYTQCRVDPELKARGARGIKKK